MTKLIKVLSLALIFSNSDAIAQEEEDITISFGNEEFVSIATGQKQLISKAPAVASVITAADIKAMGAIDIDDVLKTVPGLHVTVNEFYNPIYAVRGVYSKFNPQVLILVNGVPVSNLFFGSRGFVWAGMPVEAINRIEVIRGPGSAVYGADAFAGTINIITKSQNDIHGLEAGIRSGSFDTQAAWLLYGHQIGDWDLALTIEYQTTDGQDEIIHTDLQTWLDLKDGTKASLAPGPVNLSRDSLDIRFELGHDRWLLRAGLQERRNIGTGAGVAEALDSVGHFKSTRSNLDLAYDNPSLADNWQLQAQISYFYTTQEIDDNLVLFPPGSELNLGAGPFPNGVIGNPEVFEHHWRLNTSAFYKGFTNHTLRIGAGLHNANIFKVKESKNFALDGNGNPLLPGSPIVSVDDTPFIFLPEGDRDNHYLFVQDVWQFSNDWELTAGIRYDDYSDFGDTVNPRLAIVWSTSHNLTTKFLYGKAFRAPLFAETRNQNNPALLGNPNLDPETMETVEIALDYKPNYKTRLGINIFHYNWDRIIDVMPDPAPATTMTAQNDGEQSGDGIELEFDWDIISTVKLVTNYAYQDSTIDTSNTTTPNVPQQQFYIRLNWTFANDWQLTNQLKRIENRKRPFGDTRPTIDDYQIANITLSYQKASSPWRLRVIGRNIFDEDAREPHTMNISNDLPLARQNFHIDFRYHF